MSRELGKPSDEITLDVTAYEVDGRHRPQDGVVRIPVLQGRLDEVILEWPRNMPVQRSVSRRTSLD